MIEATKLLLTTLRSIDALKEHAAELPLSERNEMADLIIDHLIEVLRAERRSGRAKAKPAPTMPDSHLGSNGAGRKKRRRRFGQQLEKPPSGYVKVRTLLQSMSNPPDDGIVWLALKRGVVPNGKIGHDRWVDKAAFEAWVKTRPQRVRAQQTNGAAHA